MQLVALRGLVPGCRKVTVHVVLPGLEPPICGADEYWCDQSYDSYFHTFRYDLQPLQ